MAMIDKEDNQLKQLNAIKEELFKTRDELAQARGRIEELNNMIESSFDTVFPSEARPRPVSDTGYAIKR